VVSVDGDATLEMATDTPQGPTMVSQLVTTPDGPMSLGLDTRFLTPGGTLEVRLGETLVLSVTPLGATSPYGTPAVVPAGDFQHITLAIGDPDLQGVTDDFELRLLPGSPAQVQIDDIALDMQTVSVGDVGHPLPRVPLLAFPNPTRGSTRFAFDVPGVGAHELRLVDLGGRLVRRIASHGASSGRQAVEWDGRDEHGVLAAPGVYWAMVEGPGVSLRAKVVVVK
jgi:hypothetical protein